jgi:hypothetical protein
MQHLPDLLAGQALPGAGSGRSGASGGGRRRRRRGVDVPAAVAIDADGVSGVSQVELSVPVLHAPIQLLGRAKFYVLVLFFSFYYQCLVGLLGLI